MVTPGLALKEEYNDNVFAVTADRKADLISTVSPTLSLNRSTETTGASLAAGLSQLLYLDNNRNDSLGYFLRGSGSYAWSPLLTLTADLGGTRETSASSIDPVTSLVSSSRTTHQNYRVGEKSQLNELLSSSATLGYGRDDFDNPAYQGTTHYLADVQFFYDLGRWLSGARLNQTTSFSRDVTSISQVDSLGATIGVEKELSELWRLSANGGGRYTHSRFLPAGAPSWESHDEVGGIGRLTLAYATQTFTGTAGLSEDVVAASGRSGATQRTGATLSFSERFTPHLSGNLGAEWARNWSGQGQFGAGAIDERYLTVGALLRYEPFDSPSDLALEAGFTHNDTDYHLSGTHMNQNVVMLRLTWQHPSFR